MPVDVMIVGAAKCGTTSLLAYLGRHPGVQAPDHLEMTWFSDPALYAEPFPDDLYFPGGPPAGRLRLGKLAGLMYREGDVDRLHALNDRVHAVVILRDPVARAYSSYWFARRRGRETREDFLAVVRDAAGDGTAPRPDDHYLQGGLYAEPVERLQHRLGADRVHTVVFEEFVADPAAALGSVVERLGLDAGALPAEVPHENRAREARSPALARARRSRQVVAVARRALPPGARDMLRRHYRRVNENEVRVPPIDPVAERELRAFFAGPNRRLEAVLGRTIDAWPRSDG
jgi:Sulfotransferase family